MTPRDLIDELRSRINPAYAAQIGTESWERRLCAEALEAQADELERLRDCAARVIAAFETLGRTNGAAGLLTARARCESVMLELRHVLTPNAELTGRAAAGREGPR